MQYMFWFITNEDSKVYIKQGLTMQYKSYSFTKAYPMVYHCNDMLTL